MADSTSVNHLLLETKAIVYEDLCSVSEIASDRWLLVLVAEM